MFAKCMSMESPSDTIVVTIYFTAEEGKDPVKVYMNYDLTMSWVFFRYSGTGNERIMSVIYLM